MFELIHDVAEMLEVTEKKRGLQLSHSLLAYIDVDVLQVKHRVAKLLFESR